MRLYIRDGLAGLEDLRNLCSRKAIKIRLALNGGMYSRKTIRWDAKAGIWRITNHIDGTRQKLTDAQLWTESNIGKWLDDGRHT